MDVRLSLETEEHIRLGTEFTSYVNQELVDTEEILQRLQLATTSESSDAVASAFNEGRFDFKDLAQIIAHHRFAVGHSLLNQNDRLDVEVRKEQRRTYGLVLPQHTLLGNIANRCISWIHTEDWAKGRFTEKDHTVDSLDYGRAGMYLCGQRFGQSKFATVADLSAGQTSAKLRELLGIDTDPAFSGQLYVIRASLAELVPSIIDSPRAPICYKVKNDDTWTTYEQFLQEPKAVVGYTSGGLGEVVFKSFEVPASNLSELEKRGVRIEKCIE